MNTSTHLRRSIVAVGLVVITLISMANPTGAAIRTDSITGGVITFTKTGAPTVSLDFSATPSCEPPPSMTVDTNTEALGGTYLVTAFNWSHDVTWGMTKYHVRLTRSTTGNLSGTWVSGSTTASHTVTSARIALVMEIYALPDPVNHPCAPSTLLCTVAFLLHINSTFPASLAIGNTFSATGTGIGVVAAFPTCTTPAHLIGMTASITTPITGTLIT